MLTEANATGTFFFNGNNFECIYSEENVDRIRYVYEQGHQVASHTWGHRDLATLSAPEVDDEMAGVDEALEKIVGAVPAFVRPPYGSFNPTVQEVAYSRGQIIAIWDFDSGDSAGISAAESKARYDELAQRHPDSVLTLNHEVHASAVFDILPHAINTLKGSGYELVSLAECLGLDPYQSVDSPGTRDASWAC